MAGRLYLIGTPIGNLSDLSPRARETLAGLDLLYCEDTRVSTKLLSHFGISVPLHALSDDSDDSRWQKAIHEVQSGRTVGFITDAGMPGVSDPGRKLVRAAWAAGIKPVVIPGPSSVGTLLAACPFVSNSFRFLGFAPRKPGERLSLIEEIAASEEPCFLFESPHRAVALLDELCARLEPERELLIGREMTKLYEQIVLFTAATWPELSTELPAVGEFTIAVAARSAGGPKRDDAELLAAMNRVLATGLSKRDAVRALAAALDVHINDIKRLAYSEDAEHDEA